MVRWMILFFTSLLSGFAVSGQPKVDPEYITNFKLPYVVKFSLERTGAGLEISPDHTLIPPAASFPFNSGINAAINLSYKFLNLSVSQSLRSRTNNRSFVVALNTYNGFHNFGGKAGFYRNVAALQDNKTLNTRSAINLVKFSPYWLIHPGYKRLSLAAITDYSQRQLQSAGAFMFEVNPVFLRARGKGAPIIPSDQRYQVLFEELAGLHTISIANLDIRAGYVYIKSIDEGKYFLSGGLFLGPGFGYHNAKTNLSAYRAMHWQSSLRMFGSAGYNTDQYFIAGSFRYTNSFTPVSSLGILAEEGSIMLTFGLRFNALEKRLPETWREMLGR